MPTRMIIPTHGPGLFGPIGNGNVPTSISELLMARKYNYTLRGDTIFKLPQVNSTKYGIKSWRYQAARLGIQFLIM